MGQGAACVEARERRHSTLDDEENELSYSVLNVPDGACYATGWGWKALRTVNAARESGGRRTRARHAAQPAVAPSLTKESLLVIRAVEVHPVPSRTRKLSPPAPMVVWGFPMQE